MLQGKPASRPIRPEVVRSWKRCVEIGVDPLGNVSPLVLSGGELENGLRENRDLIEFAKPVMEMIEISVRDTGFIVSVAERNGCVLLVNGDKEIMEMAGENYYQPGCLRTTEQAGTNAIGVCLADGKARAAHGGRALQHPLSPLDLFFGAHPWTSGGEIIGVITLSGRSIGRHKHTLALVTAAAETIESQLRERELAEEKLRLSSMLSLVFDSISGGVITVDPELNDHPHQPDGGKHARAGTGSGDREGADRGGPKPESTLVRAFKARNYFSGVEIGFSSPLGHRSFMCSVDPIRDSSGHGIGAIITLAEKRQVISMAKKIGGNYAKYRLADIKGRDPELSEAGGTGTDRGQDQQPGADHRRKRHGEGALRPGHPQRERSEG